MKYYTTKEAAKRLGVSVRRIQALVHPQHGQEARLPAQKVGRDWLISFEDLDNFQSRGSGRPKKEGESETDENHS